MNQTVSVLHVKTAKDLVMEYLKDPAQDYMIGFAEDIGKHVLSVRFLDGLHGFAGLSVVEKGLLSTEVFADNETSDHPHSDIYSLYVLEGDVLTFVTVSSIVDHAGDSEFGSRITINWKKHDKQSEQLTVVKAREYMDKLFNPRFDKGIQQLF